MSIKFHNDISYKYISSITYSKLLILKLCIKDKFIKKNSKWYMIKAKFDAQEWKHIYIYIYWMEEWKHIINLKVEFLKY